MIKIIDKEQAIKKINDTNPNYIILSDFHGWREDITRECKTCGDVRTVKARALIEKDHGRIRQCPVCAAREKAKNRRKTHEDFIIELNNINPNIEILSEYRTTSEKVLCRCTIDDFKWYTTPHSLLEGHGCPECSNRKQNRRTNEQFLNELKIKYPTITPLEDFTKVNDSMKFKCDTCDYEWQTAPNVLLNKENYSGCPKCANLAPISEKEMVNRLESKNKRIKYISGYKGILKRAKFSCLSCGNEWETPVNSVLSGRGCPKCNMSHGAIKIEEVLRNMSLDYSTEYRFEDCKDARALPFDFYVKEKNTCIEYDGEQHFMPVRFSKKQTDEQMEKKFEECQRRDKIKTDYCKNNHINLIRIPYTDYSNIEQILNKYLS